MCGDGKMARVRSYSVLVTAYNEQSLLPYCLDAINNQSTKPSLKLLVDDGSTDKTSQIANEYGFKMSKVTLKKYVEGYKNRARAFIEGVSQINTDFLLKVDADIVIPFDYAEKLLKIMEIPRIGVTSGSSTKHYNKRGISNGAVMYRREALTTPPLTYGWDRGLVLNALRKGYKIYSHPTLRYIEMRAIRVIRPPLHRLAKNYAENIMLKLYSEIRYKLGGIDNG